MTITGAHQAVPRPPDDDAPPEASLDDWSFVRGTSPDPELPHWTEAPTGQVPAVLARDDGDAPPSDDPWSSLPAPSWRQDETDWTAHEERFEPAMLGDEGGDRARARRRRAPPLGVRRGRDATTVGVPVAAAAAAARRPSTRRARTQLDETAGASHSAGRAARRATTARCGALARGPPRSRDMPRRDHDRRRARLPRPHRLRRLDDRAHGGARGHRGHRRRRRGLQRDAAAGHRPAAALGLVACLSLMIASLQQGHRGAAARDRAVLRRSRSCGSSAASSTPTSSTASAPRWSSSSGSGVLGAFAGLLLAPATFPDRRGVHFLLGRDHRDGRERRRRARLRQAARPPPDGAADQPQQDLGGRDRRRGRHDHRRALRVAASPAGRSVGGARARHRRRGARAARRPVRVDGQAQPRR